MAKLVVMPALGMAQEAGTLLKWLKAPGEPVRKGELLMEIETDKAVVEVEALADGVLAHVRAQPGDVIPVGQPIAVLLSSGETPESVPPPAGQPVASPPRPVTTVVKAVPPGEALSPPAAATDRTAGDSIEASPLARRLAQEHGIDLALVRPFGGKIQKEDVLAYLEERSAGAHMGHAEPLGRVWRLMAERVTQAWTSVPHFYLFREVGATRLNSALGAARSRYSNQITYTDLLIKLVGEALQRHPRLNASWKPPGIEFHREVNIGLAVAVEDGLVVPVIHRADQLDLKQIEARRGELIGRARAGRLTPEDISGGTFTITNLGMSGVDAFTAIIPGPQAAILAVGRVADRVVVVDGSPVVRPMLTLCLGCDHRAADGARGAEFLQSLAEFIEGPEEHLFLAGG